MTLRKAITSALVLSGTAAISMGQTAATEHPYEAHPVVELLTSEEEVLTSEEEVHQLLKQVLRTYANPLKHIQQVIEQQQASESIIYTVKQGDTLSGIAVAFGLSINQLVQENDINNQHLIREGQILSIPLKEKTYTVKHGETLEKILEAEGLNKEDVLAYNPVLAQLDHQLLPGQTLHLPTLPTEPVYQPIARAKKKGNQVLISSVTTADVSQEVHFLWPLEGILTSRFGMRWGRMHQGIDIAHRDNERAVIKAAKGGIVTEASYHRGGYGNLVIVDHENGYVTYYAHLSSFAIKEGERVEAGQLLGQMGRTGHATGYHLHFEIRHNNRPQNPLTYLP